MATDPTNRARQATKRQYVSAPTTSNGTPASNEHVGLVDEGAGSRLDLPDLMAVANRLEAVADRLERLLPNYDVLDERRFVSRTLPRDIEARREALRPPHVRVLFITTAIFPDDATNFYDANSHLFRCIRGAFVRALGPAVPPGEAFLPFFMERGCWLYHVAPQPTRGPGRPRTAWVRQTISSLTSLLAEINPDHIVAVKAKLKPRIIEAAQTAGMLDRVTVVSTPRMLWERKFFERLVQILDLPLPTSNDGSREGFESLDIVDAILQALLDHSNKRQRARELSDFIEGGLNESPGASPLRKTQISAIIRSRPDIFDVNSAGVRVRDGGDARGRRAGTLAGRQR